MCGFATKIRAASIMSDFTFWDDAGLAGSIDRAPLPPSPCSFFDENLMCNEFIGSDASPMDLHEFRGNAFPEELRQIPELPLPLCPLPSLSSPQNDAPVDPAKCAAAPPITPKHIPPPTWGSFLDYRCPLRKRVKITITPQVRAKRPSSARSPEPSARQAKKPRTTPRSGRLGPLLPPRETYPRRLQTTLRYSRSGDMPGRITLQLPHDQIPLAGGDGTSPSAKTELKFSDPIEHEHERYDHDRCSGSDFGDALQDVVDKVEVGEELNKEDLDFSTNSHMVLENRADIIQYMELESGQVPLHAPPMRPRLCGTPHASAAPNGSASGNSPNNCRYENPQNCINNELTSRITKVAAMQTSGSSSAAKVSPVLIPLVEIAVQTVSKAAQSYHAQLQKAGSEPCMSAVHLGMRNSTNVSVLALNPKTTAKARSGPTTARSARTKKKNRNRRILLSFDDHDVAPLVDKGFDDLTSASAGLRDKQDSVLLRYLNSPSVHLQQPGIVH